MTYASAIFAVNAEVITIGVLAHRGAEFARERWSPTIALINTQLPDIEFSMRPLSLEGVQSALENGEINFLLTNPGHYYGISDKFRLTKVATLKTDRSGKPVTGNRYGSVIFVKSERNDIRTLGDLRGKSFAAVAPDAFGGFLAAAHVMQRNGINPYQDLGALKYMGFPQDEIVMSIIRGEEDVGTVRTGIIESMIASKKITPGDIRIINLQKIDGFDFLLSTDLFPEWTFAATQNTPAKLRKDVAQILFSIDESTDAARMGRYGGWNTPMFDGGVRELLLAVRKSGEERNFATNKWYLLGLILFLFAAVLLVIWIVIIRKKRSTRQGKALDTNFLRLTPRENEVLSHVVAGKTNKEVARVLNISPKTVEFHRKHLMQKLNADNLADLVRIAVEREILTEGPKT